MTTTTLPAKTKVRPHRELPAKAKPETRIEPEVEVTKKKKENKENEKPDESWVHLFEDTEDF